MAERLFELKEKREEERKEFVRDKLYQRERMATDEIR
jgi:hypothetical protein